MKKHSDVDVLIAAVDSCHMIATKTIHGRTLYKTAMRVCIHTLVPCEYANMFVHWNMLGHIISFYLFSLQVRNTQKQYMRVELPQHCDIWSVVVKGQVCARMCVLVLPPTILFPHPRRESSQLETRTDKPS